MHSHNLLFSNLFLLYRVAKRIKVIAPPIFCNHLLTLKYMFLCLNNDEE